MSEALLEMRSISKAFGGVKAPEDVRLTLRAGEPLVEALMLESQAQMVVAEQMQDRCVKDPDVDGILDDVVAEVVRRSVDHYYC